MSSNPNPVWHDFLGLPSENESYILYFLKLKFIWAPIVNVFSLLFNWVKDLFYFNDSPPLYQNSIFSDNLYSHSSLSESLDNPNRLVSDQMLESFKNQLPQDHLGNTPLTSFLANHVFSDDFNSHKSEILSVLKELVELSQHSDDAKKLLVTANHLEHPSASDSNSGLPRNTPLMLMVKAGDIDAVRLLLSCYSADDLMECTPRGNSVFHIAAISGQAEVLQLLRQRANELGIEPVCMSNQNHAKHSPEDMLKALTDRDRTILFKPFLDFVNPLLGGEEINKAAISHSYERVLECRHAYLSSQKRLTSNSSSELEEPSRPVLQR